MPPKLGSNERAVIAALKERSLNRLEIASFLHRGDWHFSEWLKPSKHCFGVAARLTDVLSLKGFIELAGDSEKIWRRKYKLTQRGNEIIG